MTEKYFRTEKTNCLRDLKRQIYLKATSFLIKSWKWYFLFFGAQKNNIIVWKLFLSNFFNLILAGNTDQNGYIRNTVQKKKSGLVKLLQKDYLEYVVPSFYFHIAMVLEVFPSKCICSTCTALALPVLIVLRALVDQLL